MDFPLELRGIAPWVSESNFPVVEGHYQMTDDWWVTLPKPMKRRFEDESLVLWRKGLTIWTIVWNNDDDRTQDEILESLRGAASAEAFDVVVRQDRGLTRYSYRLDEEREEGLVHALYVFSIADIGHVQMAIYFDVESDLEEARAIGDSLRLRGARVA
jgi:hypothetical protein